MPLGSEIADGVAADRILSRRGAMPEEDERTEHVRFINNYERDTQSGLAKSVFICTVTITIDNYCSCFGQNYFVEHATVTPTEPQKQRSAARFLLRDPVNVRTEQSVDKTDVIDEKHSKGYASNTRDRR
jgi:hypothetical protein